LGPRGYEIVIGAGSLAALGHRLRDLARATAAGSLRLGPRALVVGDENTRTYATAVLDGLTAGGFAGDAVLLREGETAKSLTAVATIYDKLASMPADRGTMVVAVGGGVVGDVAGFAAATYARGVPWVVVPTTLLAMVDSAVGGKVGVNHPRGKNLIGAFHQPRAVWIDLTTLGTLPEREYRSGLAEVVKYGVALDAELFDSLEAQAEPLARRDTGALGPVVARCCELKARVVEEDEQETTGRRAVLNYGHTFAHAFEAVAGYGRWLHGEAVAAGMACAARLAVRVGQCPPDVEHRQNRLLARFGLPTRPDGHWLAAAVLEVMRTDKKAVSGRLRFVLPSRLGAAALVERVDERAVIAVLHEIHGDPPHESP
jgi:3-dehydroquinate synthase